MSFECMADFTGVFVAAPSNDPRRLRRLCLSKTRRPVEKTGIAWPDRRRLRAVESIGCTGQKFQRAGPTSDAAGWRSDHQGGASSEGARRRARRRVPGRRRRHGFPTSCWCCPPSREARRRRRECCRRGCSPAPVHRNVHPDRPERRFAQPSRQAKAACGVTWSRRSLNPCARIARGWPRQAHRFRPGPKVWCRLAPPIEEPGHRLRQRRDTRIGIFAPSGRGSRGHTDAASSAW